MSVLRILTVAAGLMLWLGPASAAENELLTKGTSLYKQFCSHCHGLNMVNPGTASYDLRKWPQDRKQEFYNSVTKGKGNMPAWGDILLPEELEALWYYVASRGGKEPLPDQNPETDSQDQKAGLQNRTIEVLRVCLAENGGVMSEQRANGGAGFDYAVSEALAQHLKATLEVIWFESEQEEESDPVKEAYAMLAFDLCDLVPGYPLYEGALGTLRAARAALPRWQGQPRHWRQRQVDLRPVAVSAPYIRIEMALVLRPAANAGPVNSLHDLSGLKVGIQQGTLAGALMLQQTPRSLRSRIITRVPGPQFLQDMERGLFDAALVNTPEFDNYLKRNPASRLIMSDYRHPLGFNLGFAALEENQTLLDTVSELIHTLMLSETIQKLAKAEHVSYTKPALPRIQPRLKLSDLSMIR